MSKSYAVIGAGFGDEGKGLVTDYLCAHADANPDLVVRFSGGQQAGHTVCTQEPKLRHTFANFGAGSLRDIPTYWSPYCTVDPVGIVTETEDLNLKGVFPTLYVDPQCPVTTPFDKYYNQNDPAMLDNGTCGVGVGVTWAREAARYSLRWEDLYNPTIFGIKLERIRRWYASQDARLGAVSTQAFERACQKLIKSSSVTMRQLDLLKMSGLHRFVFEGSQGLLLDQDIGFFPHVTRSHTGTKNILSLGETPEVYLVSRAYQTRHGAGPMTNTEIRHHIIEDPREHNQANAYQGAFRRSLLDLDLLRYGISRDKYLKGSLESSTLVLTCLDHLAEDGYRFTDRGELWEIGQPEAFVWEVATRLGLHRVLVSRSPYARNIEGLHKGSFT